MIEIKKSTHPVEHDTIFVFFSGGWDQAQRFNFETTAAELKCPAIFVRDISANFYNTDNFDMAQVLLQRAIYDAYMRNANEMVNMESTPVVFVGTSMGGYGAMKFINAGMQPDKCVIFAGQISWEGPPHAPDISKEFLELPVRTDYHYCEESPYPSDHEAARILREDPDIVVISWPGKEHNVAGLLAKRGEFVNVLKKEIK